MEIKQGANIVQARISRDSSRLLVVRKLKEKLWKITQYCLQTANETFDEEFAGSYIKIDNIVQNMTGTKYGVICFDDGVWRIRTFGKEERTEAEIKASEINVNDLLGLDNWTMVDPATNYTFGSCCFVDDNTLFVGVYHSHSMTHHHCMIDLKTKALIGKKQSHFIEDSSARNFLVNCYYNVEKDECYSFYRGGQAFTMPRTDISKFRFEQISNVLG